MTERALGLIETKGLVAAIEALDACLKAAQVHLAGMDFVSGGLVTIRVRGDVGAVKAAVSAGEAAARRVGTVVSAHVIPRPDCEIEGIAFGPGSTPGSRQACVRSEAKPQPEGHADAAGFAEVQPVEQADASAETGATLEEPQAPVTESEIEATMRLKAVLTGTEAEEILEGVDAISSLQVAKLRRIARHVPGMRLGGVEISNARKDQLISEMVRAALNGGEGANED